MFRTTILAATLVLAASATAQNLGTGTGSCNGQTASSAQRFASPPNQATLIDISGGPILGGSWDLAVTPGALTPAFEAYVIAFAPANVQVTVPNVGTFTALVDLSFNLTVGVLAGSGLQLALPNDPVLCGVGLHAQAGVTDGQVFELSNAVDGVCGE